MAVMIAAGVMAAMGAVSSIVGGKKQAKAAKKAAAEEARLEGLVTAEKIRSLKVDERVLRGQTIGGAAGSGVVTNKGSPLEILAEQAREYSRERGITSVVGASRASQSLARGSMAADAARYNSYSSAASQFSSMFSSFSQARGG